MLDWPPPMGSTEGLPGILIGWYPGHCMYKIWICVQQCQSSTRPSPAAAIDGYM